MFLPSNFSLERPKLELYRGHPTIRTRRQEPVECVEEEEVIYTPFCIQKKNPPPPRPQPQPYEPVDFQSPEYKRCREIPYSGEDILNRAKDTEMCSGYM